MAQKVARSLLRSSCLREPELCRRFSTQVAPAYKTPSNFRTSESNPTNHTKQHEGLFYTVPPDIQKSIFQIFRPTKKMEIMNEMFAEFCVMVRQPFLEVKAFLENYNYNLPALRIMLYGKQGSGKAVTQAHLLHYAAVNNWLILSKDWAPMWVKRPKEHTANATDETLIDSPIDAAVWLQHFRVLNSQLLQELNLTATETYKWSEREVTEKGEPLTNIIDHGVERIKHSCDCLGALLREVKQYTNSGRVKTLVILRGVNTFWHDSYLRRLDGSFIPAEDFSIVRHFKEVLKNDWKNAAIVVTVDPTGLPLRHLKMDQLDVPSYYPKYLLGLKGFEFFEPFVPVHVPGYSEKEIESCLDYYVDRRYIQNRRGWTEEGRMELKFLSGYNPHQLARICQAR
ncbi:unnamed protein product [Ixodes pacificus]